MSGIWSRLLILMTAVVALPACEVVEGIFKAGVGVGLFLAILFVALVLFVIGKVRRRV